MIHVQKPILNMCWVGPTWAPSSPSKPLTHWPPLITRIRWFETQLDGADHWIGCSNLKCFLNEFPPFFCASHPTLGLTWVSARSPGVGDIGSFSYIYLYAYTYIYYLYCWLVGSGFSHWILIDLKVSCMWHNSFQSLTLVSKFAATSILLEEKLYLKWFMQF